MKGIWNQFFQVRTLGAVVLLLATAGVSGCPSDPGAEPAPTQRFRAALTTTNSAISLRRYIYEGNHLLVEAIERAPLSGELVVRVEPSPTNAADSTTRLFVEQIKMQIGSTGVFRDLRLRLGIQVEQDGFSDLLFDGSAKVGEVAWPLPTKKAEDLLFEVPNGADTQEFILRIAPVDWVPLFEASNESLSFAAFEFVGELEPF